MYNEFMRFNLNNPSLLNWTSVFEPAYLQYLYAGAKPFVVAGDCGNEVIITYNGDTHLFTLRFNNLFLKQNLNYDITFIAVYADYSPVVAPVVIKKQITQSERDSGTVLLTITNISSPSAMAAWISDKSLRYITFARFRQYEW